MMTLEQAAKESNERMARAMKLHSAGNDRGAIKVLAPLTEAFNKYVPAGKTAVRTFQSQLELSLHMLLSETDDPPPDCYGAHVNLVYYLQGSLCLDLNDVAKAAESLDKSIFYNPVSAATLFEFAECFKQVRDWDQFEQWTRNAFFVNMTAAHVARAYRNMGYLLIEKEQYADAAAFFHLSKTYAPSGTADTELFYIIEKAGIDVFPPDRKTAGKLCEKYDVPLGPAGSVRGLIRGHIIAFNQHGHPELAEPLVKLLAELHPGQDINEVLKPVGPAPGSPGTGTPDPDGQDA